MGLLQRRYFTGEVYHCYRFENRGKSLENQKPALAIFSRAGLEAGSAQGDQTCGLIVKAGDADPDFRLRRRRREVALSET
jgi:hypothetical protein